MRGLVLRSFCVLVVLLACLAPVPGKEPGPAPLGPSLTAAMESASPGQLIPVMIHLKGAPTPDEVRFAAQGKSGPDRRAVVRQLLRSRVEAAQAPLLTRLRYAARAGQAGARLRPLWIVPAVGAALTPAVVRDIAALPEVTAISLAAPLQLFGSPAPQTLEDPPQDDSILAPPECGISLIRAPQVWSTYGTRGQGVVVALIDSGSCYTHADIKNHIWVNPGEDINHNGVVMDPADKNGVDDDGNGFIDDLIGWDFGGDDNAPNDIDGHGSHTAGIIVGDGTSGRQTGVAPGAKLMVIRIGEGNLADNVDALRALQYAADNGADVTSMSFGAYHADGPDRAAWRLAIDNVNAMGMITVNAAGNAGGSNPPEDVGTPADVPATIAVGAVDCLDVIASFSSQGPTSWSTVVPYFDFPYPPGLEKPEVVAPGVATFSLDRCTGYIGKNGTSMSAPHVAGAAALVLSRKPDISQAEMKHILTSTAVDLGTPGWDRAYGYGRIDAYAAAGAIGGWVNYASHRELDPPPIQGNGDGAVDPGERITLPVTLHNSMGTNTAQAVSAELSSATPGIAVHDNLAFYPDIPAGSSAESLPPHFTFTVSAPCGGFATFDLITRYSDGQSSRASFLVRLGSVAETTLFADNFETDRGWTRSGTSTAGFFVREDPHRSLTSAGEVSQPEDDHSSVGTRCMVTGNHFPIPNSEADDVDGGTEILLSPRFDLRGWQDGMLEFWEWSFLAGEALMDRDTATFYLSNDDGATWVLVGTEYYPGNRFWNLWQVSLFTLPTTNLMRFKAEITDAGRDSVVDTLIDDFRIIGRSVVCDSFTPPPARPPNPVGPTLRLTRQGADLRFEWEAPPVDGAHDPATLYRLHRSADPAGDFTEAASATVTWHIETGAAIAPDPILFYFVTAENNGGLETPSQEE